MSTSKENFLKVESQEFDLNMLFSFQASFDQLKFVLSALARNQKKVLDRVCNIEKNVNITNVDQNGFIMREASENFGVNDNTHANFNNNQRNSEHFISGNNSVIADGHGEIDRSNFNHSHNTGSGGDMSLDFLINRIVKLEKALAGESEQKSGPDVNSLKRRINDLENKMKNLSGLEEMSKGFEDMKRTNEKLEKDFEEISVKVQDFNIYELFKANSADGGSTDMGVILVQNLEKKVFKKFEFIDEKGKRSDEEIYKLKVEINNLKNANENSNKNITHLTEELQSISNENKTNIDILNTNTKVFEEKLEKIRSQIIAKINSQEIEMQNNLNKIAEDHASNLGDDKQKVTGSVIGDEDMKMMKENYRRVIELEKSFKVFVNNSNFENLRTEVTKLNELMATKMNANEVGDLRENMTQLTTQVIFIKDSISQLMEDRKMIDDINWLRKKVENLNSTVLNMKNTEDSHNNSSITNKVIPMDNTKFLETNIFNEFQKSYNRELDRINRYTDELKRYIDDIIGALKAKAGEKDMKNLEEYLNGRVEELKLNCNKKFADKVETGKNIKYLDTQLKHIIDVYIKKMEKGDNWLMAKKPVNGFSCASCESYIGELPDSNQYVPWNKYPIRDPNEKAYRIGNGFSRMLQMLNVDGKRSGDQVEEMSDEETGKSLSNLVEKKLILPNVHQKQSSGVNAMNMSMDEQIKFDEDYNLNSNVRDSARFDDSNIKQDPYKPKIVKIFKKVKNPNNGSIADINQINPAPNK